MVSQVRVLEEFEDCLVLVLGLHEEQDRWGNFLSKFSYTLARQGVPDALTVPAHSC